MSNVLNKTFGPDLLDKFPFLSLGGVSICQHGEFLPKLDLLGEDIGDVTFIKMENRGDAVCIVFLVAGCEGELRVLMKWYDDFESFGVHEVTYPGNSQAANALKRCVKPHYSKGLDRRIIKALPDSQRLLFYTYMSAIKTLALIHLLREKLGEEISL